MRPGASLGVNSTAVLVGKNDSLTNHHKGDVIVMQHVAEFHCLKEAIHSIALLSYENKVYKTIQIQNC